MGIPNVSHLFLVAIDGFRLLQCFNLLPMWGYYGVFAIAKGCKPCIFWGAALGRRRFFFRQAGGVLLLSQLVSAMPFDGTEVRGAGQFTSVWALCLRMCFFGVFTNRNRKEKPMGGGDMLRTSTYYCHT